MPEQHDHNWGEVNPQGRFVILGLLSIGLFVLASHLDKVALGLEHDMANGFRVAVTEPFDHLLDDIYNTPNLNVIIGVGFAINAGIGCLWLASYLGRKSK
jgi:hypothetical protein